MLQKEKRHEGKRPQSASGRQGGGKRRAGGAPGGGGSNGGDGDGDDEDEEDAAEEAEEEEEEEEEEELEDAEFDAQDKKQVFLYMLLLCVLPVVHSFFCKFLPFTSHIFSPSRTAASVTGTSCLDIQNTSCFLSRPHRRWRTSCSSEKWCGRGRPTSAFCMNGGIHTLSFKNQHTHARRHVSLPFSLHNSPQLATKFCPSNSFLSYSSHFPPCHDAQVSSSTLTLSPLIFPCVLGNQRITYSPPFAFFGVFARFQASASLLS